MDQHSGKENIVCQSEKNSFFMIHWLRGRGQREELRPKVPRLYNSCSHTRVPLREGMLDGDTEEHTRTSNQEECHPTDIVPMEGIANLQNTDPYLFAISMKFIGILSANKVSVDSFWTLLQTNVKFLVNFRRKKSWGHKKTLCCHYLKLAQTTQKSFSI